jgi:hypothetical protein
MRLSPSKPFFFFRKIHCNVNPLFRHYRHTVLSRKVASGSRCTIASFCPMCYGIQLWGTASTSNIEIVERFYSKALRMVLDAPWYVPNTVIRRDVQILTVKQETRSYSPQYSARLSAHPNDLIVNIIELPDNRRLRSHLPNDLPTRFLV